MTMTSPATQTTLPFYAMTAAALAAGPVFGLPLALALYYPKSWVVQLVWHTFIDLTGSDRMAIGALVDEAVPFLAFVWLMTAPIAGIMLWVRSRSMLAPALLLVPVAILGPGWLALNLDPPTPLFIWGLRLTLLTLAVISVVAAWQLVRPLPRHPTV